MGVAARFRAQYRDDVVGGFLPVDIELACVVVQEDEPRAVGRTERALEHRCVEGLAERVGGEHVEAAVAYERGRAGDRVEDVLDAGSDRLFGGSAASGRDRGLRGA